MKNVLIVDDQASIRQIVSLILRKDFALAEAEDAATALEKIKLLKPDAMVLDVMMPGEMDGLGFCRQIKASAHPCYVVMISGKGQQSDIDLGMHAGADLYKVKPISPAELISIVEKYAA